MSSKKIASLIKILVKISGKANVITKNTSWYKYIKNPNSYIDRKINKLNKKNKKLKKKIIYFSLML